MKKNIQWIDSHAHLHLIKKKNYKEIIELAKERNVVSIINVATNINSYQENKEQVQKGIYLSIGIYPSYCDLYTKKDKDQLIEYLKKDPIVAIGECGIDYYRNYGKNQIPLFQDQVNIAQEFEKPLIIHIRNSFEDIYEILSKSILNKNKNNGVIHCYTGNIDYMKKFIDLGFYISFSGIVTFKNATELQKVAIETPLERIIIETDSPYLTPNPYRGEENHPGLVEHTGKFIANLKNISIENFSEQVFNNTYSLFNLQSNFID